MNTVKHYKDLGLEFVGGDMVDCSNTSKPIVENINGHELEVNNLDYGWGTSMVYEFAWRQNTGEKPAFGGEIEVKHRNGGVFTNEVYMKELEVTGSISDIIEWRPLITQPKPQQEKPIFTQEMADDKELAHVGAEFMALGVKWTCSALHVKGGVIGENQIGELRRFSIAECKPVKTMRDIEIDLIGKMVGEMLSGATKQNDFQRLYEMGYRVTKVEE